MSFDKSACTLEVAATRWLALQKRTMLILSERTPRHWVLGYSRPDLLGVMPSRHMIEIEIKRSWSDYHANAEKRHVQNRDFYLRNWPQQYYFCAPMKLAERIATQHPEWAGVMGVHGLSVEVLKKAPKNALATKLTIKECIHLGRLMGYELMSLREQLLGITNQHLYGEHGWGIEYAI